MSKQQTDVVVLGAGYAGLLATVRLARQVRRVPVRITLVNASPLFVERVQLHRFAAHRTLPQRPIARTLRGTGVHFVVGTAHHLDPAARTLAVQTEAGEQRISYDYLVYALGSQTDRDRVPGVREYAYTLAPDGPLSASALRPRLAALAATGGRVVVCGGGATGIEAAAEFATAYPHLRVHLITRGPLAQFLGAEVAAYIRTTLEGQGVTIQDRTTIEAVHPATIETTTGSIPYDACLWTGGFVAPPLAREAGLAVNGRGQIWVDPSLRSVSHPTILAVGDAAQPVEDPGVPVRMSAFSALILGAHGADCLAATLRGQSPRPLSFVYAGQGIALGDHTAIGFGKTPDDRPHPPYFTGRAGYAIREVGVRLLANIPTLDRRLPGGFTWTGKGRYAAMRRAIDAGPVDSTP